MEQEIKTQAAINGRNERTLDAVARYVGAKFPEISGQRLVDRVGEIARQLKLTQDELDAILNHKKEIPTYIFDTLSKANNLLEIGDVDGAHTLVQNSIARAQSEQDFNIREYVKLISLFAKLIDLQQNPKEASRFLHKEVSNLSATLKELQVKLYTDALYVEMRWAEHSQSEIAGEQALRTLISLIQLNDPSVFSTNLRPVDYRDINFPFSIPMQCRVANIYLIASKGDDFSLINAGLSQFDIEQDFAIMKKDRPWECEAVLGHLEMLAGALKGNRDTFQRGVDRINVILDFYGNLQVCPIDQVSFGISLYRFAMRFESKSNFNDFFISIGWRNHISHLKFAGNSFLGSPPPVDLDAFLKKHGFHTY